MKLTDKLPNWIAWPLRLVLYAFVLIVLLLIAMAFINYKMMNNAAECNNVISGVEPGLKHARAMAACLKGKNGLLENWMADSAIRAIEALPNSPEEFAGTWDASQPGCNYRHKLEANGEFVSEDKGCPGKFILYSPFHGVWGVYDNKMIWLPDKGVVWPPVINPMDVVDKDFFLLVEPDGSRTKFFRVNDVAAATLEKILPEATKNYVAGDAGIESPSEEKGMAALQEAEVEPSEIGFTPKFKASDPNAPLEAAVLYGGVILPVLSVPSDRRQLSGIDSRLTPGDDLLNSCATSGGHRCKISAALVAKHHYMSSIPDSWFDAEGNVYEIEGGMYVVSDTGNSVGFDLRGAHLKSEKPIAEDPVLLNRKEGFSFVRKLPAGEWQEWPEFRQELQSWANQYFSKCNSASGCEKSISRLSSAKNFHGEAREFKFPDGRKLQFLQAESQTEGGGVLVQKPAYAGGDTPPDTLKTNLWRLVNTDGSVHILRISHKGWLDDLGNTVLNYPYCDSQCGPSWTGKPEVISAEGGTFMFGPYAGGTVSGYLFFEVLSTELKFIGWYRWGS